MVTEGGHNNIIQVGLSSWLAAAAAASILLWLFLPLISLDDAFLSGSTGGSISGEQLLGWVAWVTFFAFALSAITRFVPAVIAFKSLFDLAALTMVVVAVLYALFASPVALALNKADEFNKHMQRESANSPLSQTFGNCRPSEFSCSLGQRTPRKKDIFSTSITPQLGIVFFLLAPLLLLVAKRREH